MAAWLERKDAISVQTDESDLNRLGASLLHSRIHVDASTWTVGPMFQRRQARLSLYGWCAKLTSAVEAVAAATCCLQRSFTSYVSPAHLSVCVALLLHKREKTERANSCNVRGSLQSETCKLLLVRQDE